MVDDAWRAYALAMFNIHAASPDEDQAHAMREAIKAAFLYIEE